jgi:hypothetical protein
MASLRSKTTSRATLKRLSHLVLMPERHQVEIATGVEDVANGGRAKAA